MKKLFIIFSILITVFMLASCDLTIAPKYDDPDTQALYEEYLNLCSERNQLSKELAKIQQTYQGYISDTEDLQARIDGLDELILTQFAFYNKLETETILSNVQVIHSITLGSTTQVELGSGFPIASDASYVYLLTNWHVIYSETKGTKEDTYIILHDGTKVDATVLASSEGFDMALLRVLKKSADLTLMPIAKTNPLKNQLVIAIGNPQHKDNSVTIGKIYKYDYVSDVQTNCIFHTAYIDHGSSGGMLINDQFEVVGINTFVTSSGTRYSVSSPCERIREFLSKCEESLPGVSLLKEAE